MAKQRRRHVLVLAQTPSEAHTYARRANLPNFTYRAVSSAAQIRNVQVVDVHVLPTFEKRRDRHAIRAALRHGRDITWINVEMPPPAPRPDEQLDLLDLIELEADAASQVRSAEHGPESGRPQDFNDLAEALEETHGSETGAPEPSEDPASDAPRRRRSRCKVCGTLHFGDEPCPSAPEPPVDEPTHAVVPVTPVTAIRPGSGMWG